MGHQGKFHLNPVKELRKTRFQYLSFHALTDKLQLSERYSAMEISVQQLQSLFVFSCLL